MTVRTDPKPSAPLDADAPSSHLVDLIRDVGARALTAAGLASIALIHLLDSIGKYHETRYLFWMYVALMVGTLVVAAALLHTRRRAAWLAAAGLAAGALVGYVINRTVGLPNATGDIGNWTEPIGLASLFVEGVVLATSVDGYRLASTRPHLRAATG